jgi:hypothetical protein
MRGLIILLLSAISFSLYSQQTLVFEGTIGIYPVEVQIESMDSEGIFTGRYRYKNKKSFIDLAGELAPPIIYMEEYYKGDTTGYWYLEQQGDSITGSWIYGKTLQKVKLAYKSGDRNLMSRKTEMDFNVSVSEDFTGDYEVNHYFLNDMWVTNENLQPELGYNGGNLSVQVRDDGNIDFTVEAVCGPTYHIAYASGIAYKNENEFVYTNEDGCVINFVFKDKKVSVESNGSMECGFGARAYLSHDFVKVSNEPAFYKEH